MRFLGSGARSGALAFFEAGRPGWVSLLVLQVLFYWRAFLGALSRVRLSWFSVMLLPGLRVCVSLLVVWALLVAWTWSLRLFEWEGHMRLC